jgi:hypothetical protein
MQTVQLAIADAVYHAALRDALVHSGPWHVESVETPKPGERCVLVMDETCLSRVPLPLPYPERVVLLTRMDPANLSQAWDAGISSLVSPDDPLGTVLLAIMAAALRVPQSQTAAPLAGFSPSKPESSAPISPEPVFTNSKRYKTQ